MDIIAHFLRWEDKYWGLFLIGLFVLAAFCQGAAGDCPREEKRRYMTALLFGLVSYIVLLCPPVYDFFIARGINDFQYEQLFHIWQYPLFLPAVGALAGGAVCRKGERRRTLAFFAGLCLLFCVAGDGAMFTFSRDALTGEMMSKARQESYQLILADSDVRAEKAVIWGPSDWMADSRVFNGDLYPVYGKDILSEPAKYTEQARSMKSGYDSLEKADETVVNLEDLTGAVANMPNVLPEVGCNYVAVPAEALHRIDTDAIFEECGYEFTGSADGLRIYHRDGQALEAGQ